MNLDALRLPAVAAVCGLLLSATYAVLAPAITLNQQHYENQQLLDIVQLPLAKIEEVVPSVYVVSGTDGSRTWIFGIETLEGYNGRIALWVGVSDNGVIEGVRVRSHQETPGLGDKIELAVSDWILGFNGYSKTTPEESWQVKRDGGDFDQFTGATITPRAVVHAVHDAMKDFETNREAWSGASREI